MPPSTSLTGRFRCARTAPYASRTTWPRREGRCRVRPCSIAIEHLVTFTQAGTAAPVGLCSSLLQIRYGHRTRRSSTIPMNVETAELIRASAQVLENSLNPVQARREAVALWLAQTPVAKLSAEDLSRRTADLIAIGFKSFDAFHLASA